MAKYRRQPCAGEQINDITNSANWTSSHILLCRHETSDRHV